MPVSRETRASIERLPSVEALAAAVNDRNLDDIEWTENRLRIIANSSMKFAGELVWLAQSLEEDGATPYEAAISAAILVIDALERDLSGERLDKLYPI